MSAGGLFILPLTLRGGGLGGGGGATARNIRLDSAPLTFPSPSKGVEGGGIQFSVACGSSCRRASKLTSNPFLTHRRAPGPMRWIRAGCELFDYAGARKAGEAMREEGYRRRYLVNSQSREDPDDS